MKSLAAEYPFSFLFGGDFMRLVIRSSPLLLLLGIAVLGCNSSSNSSGGFDVETGKNEVVAKVTGMS
jgi:hypothetical protein